MPIQLEVENIENRLVVHIKGSRSKLFAPFVEKYFEWLNRAGPIATDNGGNIYSLFLPPVPSKVHCRMIDNYLYAGHLKKPRPQSATIAVTYDCQLRCIHCSAPLRKNGQFLLSLKELEEVIKQSMELGANNITLTGGEPLLREDLEDIIARVDPEKAISHVFTNGLALDNRRASSLKAAGLYAVIISLDSPLSSAHDRSRGRRGTFRAVERGVRAALDAGLLVGLSSYATNEFVAEGWLQQMAALATEWGVHELIVLDVIPTGRLLHRGDMLLTKENRQALLHQTRRFYRKHRGRPRITTQTWTNSGAWFALSYGCLAGSYTIHVTGYGDVTPCDFTPLSFGNIREKSLVELWKKLTSHPAYWEHRCDCRMQSQDFRKTYIEKIPIGATLPFPIDRLFPSTNEVCEEQPYTSRTEKDHCQVEY